MTATARAMPSSPASFLSFDFSLRRVGVASGNTLTGTATPLATIRDEGDARFAAIGKLVDEWRPAGLVVGVPRHPDGAPHDNTRRAERFARQLAGRFDLPVHAVDERWTTTEAHAPRRRGGQTGPGRAPSDSRRSPGSGSPLRRSASAPRSWTRGALHARSRPSDDPRRTRPEPAPSRRRQAPSWSRRTPASSEPSSRR